VSGDDLALCAMVARRILACADHTTPPDTLTWASNMLGEARYRGECEVHGIKTLMELAEPMRP
jgi:hypothetical protein